MERAQYNRHSRARMAETAKDASRHPTPDAPERIDHRKRCTRNDHRTVLLRIARERVPTHLTCGAGARPGAVLPIGPTLDLSFHLR